MKPIVHIAAKLLTAYFIALPILFGYHNSVYLPSHHQHDHIEDNGDTMEYAQFDSNCKLCDLYESQTATVKAHNFNVVTIIQWFSFPSCLTANFTEVSFDFAFLRGPPIA